MVLHLSIINNIDIIEKKIRQDVKIVMQFEKAIIM